MMWRVYYAVLACVSPAMRIVFKVYNKLIRQPRAKVVVQDAAGRVLLVRNALGDRQWTLPGGGVDKGETASDAARRELREELGLVVDGLQPLGSAPDIPYEAPVFWVQISDAQAASMRRAKYEILAAAWYDAEQLPRKRQPLVTSGLSLLSQRPDIDKMVTVYSPSEVE